MQLRRLIKGPQVPPCGYGGKCRGLSKMEGLLPSFKRPRVFHTLQFYYLSELGSWCAHMVSFDFYQEGRFHVLNNIIYTKVLSNQQEPLRKLKLYRRDAKPARTCGGALVSE